MNKNIIALALAGLAVAPTIAQAQVTIFGTADAGYRWSGHNIDPSVGSRSRIDSGTSVPSRLGFTGSEDLGAGYKAAFILEAAIDLAGGGGLIGGGGFSRQAFVSLASPYGTVALGRQYVPGYLLTSEVDPFGSVTVGQYNNVYLTEYRWDNVVGYTSPSWSGFSVAAAYTLNGYGQESIANRGSGAVGDVRAVGVVPQYRNGPLFIGLNLQELRAKSTGVDATGTPVAVSYDGKKVRAYDLGGTYDLGFAKLAAGYGIRRADVADFSADTGAIDGKESKQWLIGATVPVSAAGKVLASFVRRTTERVGGGDDARANQWAVGYEHALSKRTALYGTFSSVNNNRGARETQTLFSSVGAGYNSGDGYQRSTAVGIRHSF